MLDSNERSNVMLLKLQSKGEEMEIKEIAQELFDTEQKIAEEKARRSALEGQLIGQIVKEGRFDLFSVN